MFTMALFVYASMSRVLLRLCLVSLSCVCSSLPSLPKFDAQGEVYYGRKPPQQLKLASILYELVISQEREVFAANHDLILVDGKVRVFIFFDPSSTEAQREGLLATYHLDLEKKSDHLFRAIVPIDLLVPLSNEPIVWFVTLPDKPAHP